MVKPLIEPGTDAMVRLKMSYEEYLECFDEDAHVEWVSGEAIVFMPPNEPHQDLVTWLVTLLRLYVEVRDLGMVLTAPFELKLPTGSSREPDILFLARRHYDRRTTDRWLGPADLVVEALSKSTATYDLREKYIDYERSRVPEYWAIDLRPFRHAFHAFVLSTSGTYQEAALDDQGRFHSIVVPGFWIKPSWFWQNPLPRTIDIITEIAPDSFRR